MYISCYYFECKSNHFAESFAPCKLELEETVSKKRVEFAVNTRKRRNIERGLTDRNYPGSSWKPKGALIAHLHEHKVISKLFFFLPRELFRYRIFFFWGRLTYCFFKYYQNVVAKCFWIYAFLHQNSDIMRSPQNMKTTLWPPQNIWTLQECKFNGNHMSYFGLVFCPTL